ncbi:catalase-like [Pararge aegeria]|uniref:catalase-like n=1 Tax=Pararge aegeria TaxID=116150 RepID=UPI0019D040C3|nr:catalase-like [Pararge aegeria]
MLAAAAVAYDRSYDSARDHILDFKERTKESIGVLTTDTGAPVSYKQASSTLNQPLILNAHFMESINHLVTKNIPERIVHAKGTGAFGTFTVTHDFTDVCMADFLSEVGKQTKIAVRFSTTTGEKGTSDLKRDVRGFAVKFYTNHGNLDLVGINIPMYFYKDPHNFRSSVQGRRRNPSSNLMDIHTSWDFLSLLPESLNTFLTVFSDRSTPVSYSNMRGHAIHTYQVFNKYGESHYCRFHFEPTAGFKTLTAQEANKLSSADPDYLTRDMYRLIADGDYPCWTLNAQVLNMTDVDKMGPDAFDATKQISQKLFPPVPIGEFCLNRNAKNFYAEIEQMAFCPGNVVKGILGAPDKLYEARVLAYRAAQVHRLGGNFNKIPVNCPFQTRTLTYNRDGVSPVGDNEGDAPNYYPNSFNGPEPYSPEFEPSLIQIEETKADNFEQSRELYAEDMTEDERVRLVNNLVESLAEVTDIVRVSLLKTFGKIHPDLRQRVAQGLNMTTCD